MFKTCVPSRKHKSNGGCFRDWREKRAYLELIGWTIFGLAIMSFPEFASTHKRDIPYQLTTSGDVIRNSQLNYPFKEESISVLMLILLFALLPLVLQIMLAIFVRKHPIEVHYTWCAYATAFGLTLCITEALKRYNGCFRPNTYDYCDWSDEERRCLEEGDNFRKSFPSGHASSSFCGSTLLACYLWDAVDFQYRETWSWKIWAMTSMTPLVGAIIVASSRVHENYHFAADVVAGSIIGVVCAVFSVKIQYVSALSRRNPFEEMFT